MEWLQKDDEIFELQLFSGYKCGKDQNVRQNAGQEKKTTIKLDNIHTGKLCVNWIQNYSVPLRLRNLRKHRKNINYHNTFLFKLSFREIKISEKFDPKTFFWLRLWL